ncbi:MAG TPA: DPP IV N-terminal domain-containing protein, partial [Mucilaginibacter sp.]
MNKFLLTLSSFAFIATVNAQQGNQLTAKDYEHAESFLSYSTEPFVDHDNVRPEWFSGDKFWYRTLTPHGSEFILVNPAKKSRSAAFDQQKLASSLSAATGKKYEADMLPFQSFSDSPDEKSIIFEADGKRWSCDLQTYKCAEDNSAPVRRMGAGGRGRRGASLEVASPDGKWEAFIKDYNLWVRDPKTHKQVQLTTDGIKDFGYATDNAGWKTSDGPILRWSPDSKKIATFKQDQREVSDMYLVTTNVGKPTLKEWKYPLPGDKVIPMIHRVIIDVDNPKVINLQVPPDPHRATLSDDIASSGTFDDVDWSPDATQLAFVSTSRDHKIEKVRMADAATGAVREIFEE